MWHRLAVRRAYEAILHREHILYPWRLLRGARRVLMVFSGHAFVAWAVVHELSFGDVSAVAISE